MKNISLLLLLFSTLFAFGQIDKEKLALEISKADAANTKQLTAYTWKRTSTVHVDGELKATIVNEVSFDSVGKIQFSTIDVQSTTKDKIGIRGRIQDNKKEEMIEYVEKALKLALSYTYMSKGEFLDFFEKSEITTEKGVIAVKGSNLYVEGDLLEVEIDETSKHFLHKKFSSSLGEDKIEGEIKYEPFQSGIHHGSETVLKLPGKDMTIQAKNHDYAVLVL